MKRHRAIAKSKLFFALIISLLVFVPALFAQTVTLKVIETSDIHGAIFPHDFINNRDASACMAQLHSFVRQERAKEQAVILLDAGDLLQGQPVVYYYNFEKPHVTHLLAEVMNFMGYDAGAVGNHDIETGHAVYDKFVQELNFPWLSANSITTKTGEPYFAPYTILNKSGVKIAVLGMVTPHIPNWLPEKIWQGMEFTDMIVTAKKWVKIIRERENPDLLFGLFHAGVDPTYGGVTAETPKNENASRLVAEQVAGFDIIFVGHDHHGWNFSVRNPEGDEVFVLGPTSSARNAAVATISMDFDADQKTWQKTIQPELVEIKTFQPDREFMQKFSQGFEEVQAYVSRRIGTFSKTVSTRDALFGNSAFVDLIHSIQLDLTGADISFTAPLSFNAAISAGDVYVRDMFKLYKYENLLYTMKLTGREVKDYLEYSYGVWFNQMADADDHLLNFQRDEQGNLLKSQRNQSYLLTGRTYNFDSAAGINYTVDVSRPVGDRVTILSMSEGAPFDPEKEYKVAINSYRGNGGGGHLLAGAKIPKADLAKRVVASTEKDLRYFLMKWIEKTGEVHPRALGNWKVIPEAWWQTAKERDYRLLFGTKHGS
ncbi:MAG: bifunctional metallophosphatase/5'-nucleotidase [bacterium]